MRTFAPLLAALLAISCQTASVPPAPPSTPERITIGPETQREIETVLQKKADAVRRGDLTTYQSTIDLSRTALRRCLLEAFDQSTRGAIPFGTLGTKIVKIEPYLDTYVRAYVQDDQTSIARRYFRREGGNWILTEPREDELGGERTKTVGDLNVSYWSIDDDISDAIAAEGVATRAFLGPLERGSGRQPFALRVYPTRSAAPPQACRTAGTTSARPDDRYIRIYALWLSPSLTTMSDETRALFRHEGLHWIQEQFSPGITVRLDWWLLEGWPDYVADVARPNTAGLICGGRTPPLSDLRRGPLDDPSAPAELATQYYSYAHSMIEYLQSRFGSEAYWNFMTAFSSTMNADVIYPQVIGESADAFYAEWLPWAKKKYC